MLKVRPKSIITFVAVFTLCTCIDPYSPKLTGYDSLLVVDGLITNANSSYTVKLSRTFQELNLNPSMVSDAIVFISDDAGNISFLLNKGDGKYKTDSLEFIGIIGRTYILHVNTREGEEYESEPCLMQPVPDIDSIYFKKENELVSNGTESQEGVRIYLDAKEGNNSLYYRWAFEETWKFKVPNPKQFDYINDSTILSVANTKEYCWKKRKSDEILIHSIYAGESNHIEKEPIFFITADQSDRLLIQYSILVSQYSISKNEYDFWNNLKQVNESGGDIFAKQPFTVVSNIHNINNTKEGVLGYFQVSAVKQRRKDIIFNEIVELDLPFYHYPCTRIEKEPSDYPTGFGPPVTWDEIYAMFCIAGDYYFVEPKYIEGTKQLQKLIFTRPECANCELTGTSTKPDFWVNLD
jgi:Domain of unknown function (DUF4249)